MPCAESISLTLSVLVLTECLQSTRPQFLSMLINWMLDHACYPCAYTGIFYFTVMDAHGDYLNLRPQNPDTARCNLTQYRHGDRGAVPVVTGVVVPDAVPNTTIRNIRNQLIQSDPAYDWMYSSAHLPRTREQSRPRARGDQYSFLPKQTHGLSRVEIAPGDRFVLEMKNMRQLIGSRPRKVASWSDARYDDLVEDKQNLSTGRMQFPARMERILVRARRNAEQFDQFESLYAAKQELRAMLHHVVAKARRIEVDDKELLSWLCTAMHRQPTRDGVDHRFSYHDTASQIYKRNRLHHRRQYQENDIHIYTDARGHGGTYAAVSLKSSICTLVTLFWMIFCDRSLFNRCVVSLYQPQQNWCGH